MNQAEKATTDEQVAKVERSMGKIEPDDESESADTLSGTKGSDYSSEGDDSMLSDDVG
jgi:hypothetical protein